MVKRSLQRANNAARRIDARQILRFQKWNFVCGRAMTHSALRFRARSLRVFIRFPHNDDMHQRTNPSLTRLANGNSISPR
jgi:hypothetical protein